MKKLISKDFTADPNKIFMPIADTLEHLQESYAEFIDSFLRGISGGTLSGGYVLHGVFDTVSGASHSISAGAILYYMNFTAWSNAANYSQFDTVSQGGYSYVAILASTSGAPKDPATNPLYWARVGKHQEAQIFLVDAQVLNPLVNLVVAYIDVTYGAGDPVPAIFSDGTTEKVHAIYKIKFKDALTGTGIADYSALRFLNTWKTYIPTVSGDDGSSTVPGGFVLTGSTSVFNGKYMFSNNTLYIRMYVQGNILALVKNLNFSFPITPLTPTANSVLSPYNAEGFNMAKFFDGTSTYSAQQVSCFLRHNGAGTQLQVSKLDGTAFGAMTAVEMRFTIAIGFRKDGE